jgi:Leucine rich repeat N-terminal domain
MKGMVGRVGNSKCDAILCPKGFFAEYGRQTFEDRPCQPCNVPDASQFMGSTTCFETPEREVLRSFFASTSGSQWVNNELWMSDAPICSWFGVTCDGDEDDDREVVLIDLHSNRLNGSVPTEIWQMPFLRDVNLANNPELDVSFQRLDKPTFSIESINLLGSKIEKLDGVSSFRNLRNITVNGLTGKINVRVGPSNPVCVLISVISIAKVHFRMLFLT